MSDKNKYGLSREIPEAVRKAIRKNSYYACIICGNALCDYEHIDPEFSNAKIHDPGKMCLLCPNHNQSKARGRLTKDVILRHMLNPFCKNKPWNHKFENIMDQHPQISIGNNSFIDSFNILIIDDVDILTIKPPENTESPFRINANFYDTSGSKIAVIEDNIIKSYEQVNDVEFKSNKIIIRGKNGRISLEIKEGEFSKFAIISFDIGINGHRVFIYKDEIFYLNKVCNQTLILKNAEFKNNTSAIIIKNGSIAMGNGGSSRLSINFNPPVDLSTLPNLDDKPASYVGKHILKVISSNYKFGKNTR